MLRTKSSILVRAGNVRILVVPPSGSILRSSLKSTMAFKIGIISDTHGLLRPEAVRRLTGVDHIIHGGDIGRPPVIADLRNIAPVTAIRGNVDKGDWADDAGTRPPAG
jgi:Calcineurin-like phosphoesterase superfamily domain